MMDVGFDFSILWSLFGALGSIVVFGICVYYVIAKPGVDSSLLVAGSFIHLLTTLFYSVGISIFSRSLGMDVYSQSWIFSIVGVINFIGTICFTAGLIVLIINHVRLYKASHF